jgi:glycosyltransferase involved in cell wall biosynthesis
MTKDLISVIIPTKNEEEVISACINSILTQTYKNIEIIVVDNKSTDNTCKIVREFMNKNKNVYLYSKGPERSAQRNYGAKKAKGEYFLFIDADMTLSKKVLAECITNIQISDKTGMVVIPEISIPHSYWGRIKAFEREYYFESGSEGIEAARFFAREAYESVGGYDESLTGPEDWDLPESIIEKGYGRKRIKEVMYHTEKPYSLWDLLKKKYYYAQNSEKYLKKHNINMVSAKTIYFLRPEFYKNWKKALKNPLYFLSMVVMLLFELSFAFIGYLKGKIEK